MAARSVELHQCGDISEDGVQMGYRHQHQISAIDLPTMANHSPTAQDFRRLGFDLVHRDPATVAPRSVATEMSEFRGMFGTWWTICAIIWRMMRDHCPNYLVPAAEPKHLLWALAYMKLDISQEVIARAICGVSPKTFAKWAWHFVEGVSFLEAATVSTLT